MDFDFCRYGIPLLVRWPRLLACAILIFLFGNSPSIAQNSLTLIEDKAKVDSILQMTPMDVSFKSEEEGKLVLALAQQIGYKIGEAKALQKLGITYKVNHKHEEAIEATTQAKHLFSQYGKETHQLQVLYHLAGTYQFFNYHKEALDVSKQTLDLAKQLQDSLMMGKALWNLGRVHQKLQQRALFFDFGKRALSIYMDNNEIEEVINVYMYFGKIAENLDTTIFYLDKVKPLLPQIKNRDHQLNILLEFNSILAFTNVQNKQYKEAELPAKKALEIARAKGKLEEIALMENYLSMIQYYHYRNYPKSIALADRYLQYEQSIGRYFYVIPTAQFLMKLHRENNQPKEALAYAELAMLYQDSLYWANRKNDVADIEKAYESENQKINILILENQRRVRTILGITIACILFLLLAFFYRQHQLKSKHLKIQKQLSEQLQQDKTTIEQQKKELETANTTKDRLFAIIGHDLRGPLFSLQGLDKKINYLLKKGQTKRLNELGQKMEKASSAISSTLNNLLNWARHEMGTFPYLPQKIELDELLNELIQFIQLQLDNKQQKLHLDIKPKLTVFVDREAMLTILRNILSNAIKYTHQSEHIYIKAKSENKQTVIEIKDSGIGMSSIHVKKMLEGERLGEKKIGTAGEKSTGLGMLISRELIQQNGGTIHIESTIGIGTTVRITFPKGN